MIEQPGLERAGRETVPRNIVGCRRVDKKGLITYCWPRKRDSLYIICTGTTFLNNNGAHTRFL